MATQRAIRHPIAPPETVDPMVSARAMSPGEKQKLWAHLNQHAPDRASFFNEPFVRQLLAQPGASACFERELVHSALGYIPGEDGISSRAPTR